MVNPVLEYWDIGEHTPENACTLPIDDLEDYDVTYKMGHKWSERELMKLRWGPVANNSGICHSTAN